jgi:hypothetical protein
MQCFFSITQRQTPLRTTHIQQELWTYKRDKAFSITPTEAINTKKKKKKKKENQSGQ